MAVELSNSREDTKYAPHNRKKLSPSEIKKLHPTQRSRYLAYEEAPPQVVEYQTKIKKSLLKKHEYEQKINFIPDEDLEEEEKREKLYGQLKAAEARNRLRLMRLRFEANRSEESNHLIGCQQNARKAVRLEALLTPYIPNKPKKKTPKDVLHKLQRTRVECLMDDPQSIMIKRT